MPQKVKGDKEDCVQLAQRAGDLALGLRDEMRQLERKASDLQSRLGKLLE